MRSRLRGWNERGKESEILYKEVISRLRTNTMLDRVEGEGNFMRKLKEETSWKSL